MNRSGPNQSRRGASAVEFAIVLPMVVAFLLASVEFGRAIHVNHALQEASQSASRVYAVKGTTKDQAAAIVSASMTAAGIAEGDYQVTYDPENKENITTHMEPVTVTVTVNYDNIGFIAGSFLNNATITGKCIMPADLEIIDDYDPINPIAGDPGDEEEPVVIVDDDDDDGDDDGDGDGDGGSWWDWWWDWWLNR